MSTAHIEAIVNAWNTGELTGLDNLVSENVSRNVPNSIGENINNLNQLKEHITRFRSEFPNLEIAIDDVITNDNTVALTWNFTGVNTGQGDLGMTGRTIDINGSSILRIENNLLVEEEVYFDSYEFLNQLGLIDRATAATG